MKAGEAAGLKAVLVTPPGEGGISVVALWGPGAAEFAGRRLVDGRQRPRRLADSKISYGFFRDRSGAVVDEVIIASASKDYVEINCHGGALPTRRVLCSLAEAGAVLETTRVCPPAAGETGAIEEEALAALFSASTDLAARALASQAGGALSGAIKAIDELLSQSPPGAAKASAALAELAGTAGLGLALARPSAVAVVGPVNAGKSTMVNSLAGFERSIVTQVPGTTRDAVRVPAALFGVPVVLVDTAGAGRADGPVGEQAALRASKTYEQADAALVVADASARLPESYQPPAGGKPAVIAANKTDLGACCATISALGGWGGPVVETSAVTGEGLGELRKALLRVLGVGIPGKGAAAGAVVFTCRQLACIEAASEALDAGDTCRARRALAECLGGR